MKRKFTEQEKVRRDKLNNLKEIGLNPFEQEFKPNINSIELKQKYDNLSKQELESNHTKEYNIAGRIMMQRDQGKAMFLLIKDHKSTIQLYIRKDSVDQKT